MHLHKKLTSRLSKVISCLNPSIDEFEIVTASRLSQHAAHPQSRDSQAAPILPAIDMMALHPFQPQLPPRQQQNRRKKRLSMVSPTNEQDLLRLNGMLVQASKSWKQTHHRKKLMAFPSKSKEANLNGDHSETRQLKRGSRVELPYWIAKPLAQFTLPTDDSLISIELPKTYSTKVRNVLDASPTSVDFKLLCPYFYLFGRKLLDLVVDDSLTSVLEKAFKTRLRDVMDFSQSIGSATGQVYLQKLDETEKELYRVGQESALQFIQWRDRSAQRIKTVELGARS
ncbi:DNA replication complex GINS protein psf3 [Mucor ambiguus]|uniref:DNA replication complex GINS protein PSF3 n=1 Tax=Mucor ambiguus TaxID=91626 RepID=A0A0C9MG94_9FUNG|nr:DNA replication complex GINS protein psf3 [Mucor ambiguus]